MSGDDTTWSEDFSCGDPLPIGFEQDRCWLDRSLLWQNRENKPKNNRGESIDSSVGFDSCRPSHAESYHNASSFSTEKIGSFTTSTQYDSTLPAAKSNRSYPLKISTNHSYSPLTSRVSSTTDQSKQTDTSVYTVKPVTMTTFFSDNSNSYGRHLNREKDHQTTFETHPSSSISSSSLIDSSSVHLVSLASYSPVQNVQDVFLDSSKSSLNQDTLGTPSPGPSLSSGFVSCSPEEQHVDESLSSRKACIVAKGILSAQSSLASPMLKSKRRKKKQKQLTVVMDAKQDEKDYVSEASSFAEKVCDSLLTSSETSLNSFDSKSVSFPSPEFVWSSGEDENEKNKDTLPISKKDFNYSRVKQSRRKKSQNVFKSMKIKREKINKDLLCEDEFKSPAYDEKLFIPKVEGWQEIDYDTTSLTSLSRNKFCDDSIISGSDKTDEDSDRNRFFTLRPHPRMQQKIQKMRNTLKKGDLKNHLLPVPTPEIPNLS